MASTICDHCGKATETVIMVPFCKYVPHGLLEEVKNHPGYDEDYIECGNECDPDEMTYEEFVAGVGEGKVPSHMFTQCVVCSCPKQE